MSKLVKVTDEHQDETKKEEIQGNDEVNPQLKPTVSLYNIPSNEEDAKESESSDLNKSDLSNDDGKSINQIMISEVDKITNSVKALVANISKDDENDKVTELGVTFNIKKDNEDIFMFAIDEVKSAALKVKNPTNKKIYFNIQFTSISPQQYIKDICDILQIGEVQKILVVIEKVPCRLEMTVKIYATESDNDDDFKDGMWLTIHADKITTQKFIWNVEAPITSCSVADGASSAAAAPDEASQKHQTKILEGVIKISKICLKLMKENEELKDKLEAEFDQSQVSKSKKTRTYHDSDDDDYENVVLIKKKNN